MRRCDDVWPLFGGRYGIELIWLFTHFLRYGFSNEAEVTLNFRTTTCVDVDGSILRFLATVW